MAKKTTIVSVSINTEFLGNLRETAKMNGVNLSSLFEVLLQEGYDRLKVRADKTPDNQNPA